MTLRSIKRILPAQHPHWVGDGFRVFPVFANMAFSEELSPFLMFDYAAPKTFPSNKRQPLGVGQHPHRGFETVTLAFKGEVEHADSTGETDIIRPGDVQWMTAGRGIIHQEFHSKEFSKRGGIFEMCQLWVNLPKKNKMTKPRYQPIVDKKIPIVKLPLGSDKEEDSGYVRVIAGSLGNTPGVAKTFSPVELWDVILPEKSEDIDLPFPPDYNCIIFVRNGGIDVISEEGKAQSVGPQAVALMQRESGEVLRLRSTVKDTKVLIMGGRPLEEPIANMGPFVMNTQKELMQAQKDYHSGKLGR